MGAEHRIGPPQIHHDWDRDREPALAITPGDVVHFDLPITGEGQVTESSTTDEVVWDFDTIYNLVGPISVEGAEPGDTLEVEILELTPGPWGWTAFIPELGLLPDDFPDPFLKVYDLPNFELKKSVKVGKLCSRLALDPTKGRLFAVAGPVPAQGGYVDPRVIGAGDIISLSLSGK